MERRVALKKLGLSLGFTVATPTLLSVLQSCTSEPSGLSPVYFSKTEGHMITQLADIILPTTEIAGALDVNVPEFMDKMFNEIVEDENKTVFKEGASAFASAFKNVFSKDAGDGTKAEFEQLLSTYFDVSEEKQQQISKMMHKDKSSFDGDKLNTFLIYKFLTETRRYTLYGYYTSELVGETILSYDPIPGVYESCIPLEDVGNAWSL